MVQVLHLSNGDTLNEKLTNESNAIGRQIQIQASDEQIVTNLFLTALARRPTDEERTKLLEVIHEYGSEQRRTALEDAYWSVLSSTEFLFNH